MTRTQAIVGIIIAVLFGATLLSLGVMIGLQFFELQEAAEVVRLVGGIVFGIMIIVTFGSLIKRPPNRQGVNEMPDSTKSNGVP